MSRFDLAVLAILSLCALLLLGLWGRSGSVASDDGSAFLLYKTVDEVGRAQLHALPFTDGEFGADLQPRPLTADDESVWDFAPSPDGKQVVYAALGEMGFSDLRLIELASGRAKSLLACENGSCSGPSWSSSGQYLAYTRRSVNAFASGLLSPPRIWILDVETGESAPIFGDSQRLGLDARWSADGEWLCFVSPEEQKLVGLQSDGRSDRLLRECYRRDMRLGPLPAAALYDRFLATKGDEWMTHLLAIDVESGEQVDLSGAGNLVHDSSAVPSPDGAWIAFQRKEVEGPRRDARQPDLVDAP